MKKKQAQTHTHTYIIDISVCFLAYSPVIQGHYSQSTHNLDNKSFIETKWDELSSLNVSHKRQLSVKSLKWTFARLDQNF